MSPSRYGARIRDRFFDSKLFRLRHAGEGIFGALTAEFGSRLKTRRKELIEIRMLLRTAIYCLKILIRWLYR